MSKIWKNLVLVCAVLFLSTNVFALQWPTLWKAKFTDWEWFNPNAQPGITADGIEDNWGIARLTFLFDLTDPDQPQVWSDLDGDNQSYRLFYWGLDLASYQVYFDPSNNVVGGFYEMVPVSTTGAYLEIYDWNQDWDASIVDINNRVATDSFNYITNGGTLLARFEFTYGINEADQNVIVKGTIDYGSLTNPPSGTGSAYLKVVDGVLKDLFDQDRDALLAAMAADGIVPQNPNAIDPEADLYITFRFSPPGQGGFQLRSEDPAYGATPEPASIILMGSGLMLIGAVARKKFIKK